MYKQLHISLMKVSYRKNNQQDYIGQILKHNSRLQACRQRMGELETFVATIEKYIGLDKVFMLK